MLVTQFDKFVNRSTQEILGSEIEQENLVPMLSTDIRNVGGVTGVKGNAEIYYRTGNVNLTPADLGALDNNNVYNGLDETSEGYALDARQGKVLNDKINATQSDIAIIIEGNQTTHTGGAAIGEFVLVRNSTISGITDGLYTAAQAIQANTAIDSTYLEAVDGGGLNALNSNIENKWTYSTTETEIGYFAPTNKKIYRKLIYIGDHNIPKNSSTPTRINVSGLPTNATAFLRVEFWTSDGDRPRTYIKRMLMIDKIDASNGTIDIWNLWVGQNYVLGSDCYILLEYTK